MEKYDLFLHALNYRGASIEQANEMWLELEACMNLLIAKEREECAKVCDELHQMHKFMMVFQSPQDCAEAIRNRK